MKKYYILLLCILTSQLFAQTEDWGDNKPKAESEWNVLRIQTQAKIFTEAHKHANWLLVNAPKLNEDLYKLSTYIYENLAKTEKNTARVTELEDSVLFLYDQRLSLFKDSADVYDKKGKVYYNYKKDQVNEADLYAFYKKNYELNGANANDNNLYRYFELSANQTKAGKVSEDDFLTVYDEIITIFDKKAVANPKLASQYTKMGAFLDQKLPQIVTMDCARVKEIYGPKLTENPNDLKSAKFIYVQMVNNKCYDEPLLLKSAYLVAQDAPNSARYRTIGNLEKNAGNVDKAVSAYEKSISLEDDAEIKSDLYLEIATMYKSSNRNTARSYANKAIATGKNTAKAYEFIGDLYMYSYNDCKNDSQLQSRLIYIAAYDKYAKAGNAAKMKTAKESFPSAEDIFYAEKKVGEAMNTGCWVNESVVLQKR